MYPHSAGGRHGCCGTTGSRSRGHFIANTDLDNEQLWVPYADGVWLQPCCINVTAGGFSRIAKPGTFIYEPAGEAHTLVVTDDSPEPAVILFIVEGGLIYLDNPVAGNFGAYEDGFSILEIFRTRYRNAGLDVAQLDALIR